MEKALKLALALFGGKLEGYKTYAVTAVGFLWGLSTISLALVGLLSIVFSTDLPQGFPSLGMEGYLEQLKEGFAIIGVSIGGAALRQGIEKKGE